MKRTTRVFLFCAWIMAVSWFFIYWQGGDVPSLSTITAWTQTIALGEFRIEAFDMALPFSYCRWWDILTFPMIIFLIEVWRKKIMLRYCEEERLFAYFYFVMLGVLCPLIECTAAAIGVLACISFMIGLGTILMVFPICFMELLKHVAIVFGTKSIEPAPVEKLAFLLYGSMIHGLMLGFFFQYGGLSILIAAAVVLVFVGTGLIAALGIGCICAIQYIFREESTTVVTTPKPGGL